VGEDKRLTVALANLEPTDWKAFEDFASVFLVEDYPDLVILAGTGDKGRDAIFKSESSGVVVQYSIEGRWREKIKATIQRLAEADISFDVLIYATNQSIAVPADEFKRELRRTGVELEPKDPGSYFIPRLDRSQATRNAAESLSRRVVDPMLPSSDAVRNSPLTSSEMKAGLLYIELQLADARAERDFTKLAYESLVLGALAAEPERRMTRNEIVAAVESRFPGHEKARIRALVSGAIQRLQGTKLRVTYQQATDSFALHYSERTRLVETAAELSAERLGLRTEIALVIRSQERDLDLELQAWDSSAFVDVVEQVLESVLERQGSDFVSALDSGSLSIPRVDLHDLAKAAIYPKARALKGALGIDQPVVQDIVELAGDAAGRLISRPGEAMQARLRRLADAYTLLAFLQQTPDVQQAVAKLFSRGTLVLDTTVVLPVFVETALPLEEQRYTNLLRAAASAGLKLVITSGVVNEIASHLARCLACERNGDRWEGEAPFVYQEWLARWPNRQSFGKFVDQFMGRDNAEADLWDFLNVHVGVKAADLSDLSRSFGVETTGIVAEAWRERKQRHAAHISDPMALDMRVNHDVEMFLGVLGLRKGEQPSVYGHEAWLVTTDSTAFWMHERLPTLTLVPNSGLAMHPNFLTNLLGVGPSRSTIEPSLKRLLPIALNLEEHGWGVHGLSEIAASIRTLHAGEPEWLIRRRLREAMDRLKSGKNAFDDGEVSDPVLVELTETGPLEAEA
jgi:hypothetical protein